MLTEEMNLLPFNDLNSSGANWQSNSNLIATDFPQSVQGNVPSGSFRIPSWEDLLAVEGMEMEFQWHFPEYTFTFTSRPAHTSNAFEANHSDPLTGDVLTDSEAVLGVAVFQAREQLESFVSDEDFLGELNQAFALDTTSEEAKTLIEDLASGETMPTLEIVAASELDNANAAFGEGAIYFSEGFLSENFNNPEVVEGVLLEEIGHYVDQELGGGDSRGDEGDIFAQLVRDETLSEAELDELQAEDDSATIGIDGEEIDVELDVPPAAPPYPGEAFSYNGEPSVPYDENVVLWQEQMEDLGYALTVDGKYGPQSESIAREFQADQGLAVDGILGPNTWAASFAAAPPYPGTSFSYNGESSVPYNESVELWQEQMRYLNYDLTVDGKYGPGSEDVARRFQEDQGLAVDGILGPNTWEASFAAVPIGPDDSSYDANEIINSAAVEPELEQYAEESVPLILEEAEASEVTDLGQIAYILATADHENGLGKYPEEISSGEQYEGREDLGNTEPGDGPRFKGRGFVQITGRNNYQEWSERLGIDLINNPEQAAELDIAAEILVQGMRDATFTGVELSDYINGENRDFVNARRIVNGLDKAEEIAEDAERYYEVLTT